MDINEGILPYELLSQTITVNNIEETNAQQTNNIFTTVKRKDKQRYKFLNVSNTSKAHSYVESEGTLRSDVLYKTIIRDMRKFYSKDFNNDTLFIKRKRYKGPEYFS